MGPDCPVSVRGGEKLTPTLQGSRLLEERADVICPRWLLGQSFPDRIVLGSQKETLRGVHLVQVLETQGAFLSPVWSHSASQHSPAQSLHLPHCHFPLSLSSDSDSPSTHFLLDQLGPFP